MEKNKITIKAGQLHAGHRQRLLGKLDTGTMEPHEYLEALLFAVEPRRDTNATAHRLLHAFGSPHGVFTASVESLLRIEGVGQKTAEFLSIVGGLIEKLYQTEKSVFPSTFDYATFLPFLKSEYTALDEEVVDAYLLSDDGRIYFRKRLCAGLSHYTETTGRVLQEIIIEEKPFAVLLVHTHPHADAKPSVADRISTRKCQRICHAAGVMLIDHCICSPKGIYSFYKSGELRKIALEVMGEE